MFFKKEEIIKIPEPETKPHFHCPSCLSGLLRLDVKTQPCIGEKHEGFCWYADIYSCKSCLKSFARDSRKPGLKKLELK